MRADRLLSILLSLQTEGIMSAKTLAEKLEVSERTIYRDVDALSFSGVPIYAIRGSHGGFALDRHYQFDVAGLTLPEIKQLLIGQSPGPLTDLGIESKQTIIDKLIMNLPHSYRNEAHQFSKRIYLDPSNWFGDHDEVPSLVSIKKAIEENRWIHINYQKRKGEIISREIAPYGLVAKMDSWYLIAKRREQMRVYRVSRIHAVQFTDQVFLFPENFNIGYFWTKWCHEFEMSRPSYWAVLSVDRSVLHDRSINGGWTYKEEAQDDEEGRKVIRIQFETYEQALRDILSLGSKVKVIEPASLLEAVRKTIKTLVGMY